MPELQAHVDMASWLRIVAASVMFYDFLVTIPSEIRLYQRQKGLPSLACVFFILARYVGLAAVISSVISFFHGWSLPTCSKVIVVVGLTRSMLSTIVNLILLGRTWVIWGRNRWIAIGMAMVLIPCTVFSYGYLFQQRPIVKAGACTAMSGTTLLSQKWIFALVNMLYDIIACVLCTIRLVRNIRAEKSIVGMSHVLLSDGIGYFVIVMIGHALNLSFLRSPQPAKQSSFLTFNVALSSVLSQRIITSLYERTSLKEQSKPVSSRSRSKGYTGALSTGTAPPNSPFSPMTPSSPFGRSPTTPNSAFPLKHGYNDDEIELSRSSAHPISIDVHSQIEEEKDTKSYLYPRAT